MIAEVTEARVGMVTTYPPDRCGIGRFSASLIGALHRQSPAVAVDVLRLVNLPEEPAAPSRAVGFEFRPDCRVSIRAAAQRLSRADVAVIQHEFGIFGDDDGVAVLDLAAATAAPLVVVLHTVLADPSARQRRIIEELAEMATFLVTPSESARTVLVNTYPVDELSVRVIPHGSRWQNQAPPSLPRRRLLSWGLLGPGKGIERGIRALADLRGLAPAAEYRVVGQIHPNVLRREGIAYRRSLEELARSVGVFDRLSFNDRYQDEVGLLQELARASVVLLPYDNREQICSGVLTEAVAAGRPVVATAFPHAVELLSGGAGVVVDHGDRAAMVEAIHTLLTDDAAYQRAAEAAARVGERFGWDEVAGEYARLVVSASDRAGAVA